MNAAVSRLVADPMTTFLPGCEGEERALREKIRLQRDIACSRVATLQSEAARVINWLVVDLANAWVFSPATLDQLRDVRAQGLRLLIATNAAERIEAIHAE